MTVRQAIAELDESKFNTVDTNKKLMWLTRLDLEVCQLLAEVFDKAQQPPAYTQDNLDAELLIPEPYATLYVHWMAAWVDFGNEELSRYNAEMAVFDSLWEQYFSHLLRTHKF